MNHAIKQSVDMMIAHYEFQRAEFLKALGGSDRITEMVAGDSSDPLYEFLKREVPPETSTIESYFRIQHENPNWLSAFVAQRITDEKDKRNLCAALGELRAYADLLQFPFVSVVPHSVNQSGADFLIRGKEDNAPIANVEVFTQNPKPNSTNIVDVSELHEENGFTFKSTIREITPYSNMGNAKEGDTIGLDAISKICAIKQDEHQVNDTVPTLYYVDLQTIIPEFSTLYNYKPITSFSGRISSGAYWHAMYGHCGDYVAEGLCSGDWSVSNMKHCGRFANMKSPSKASAFLFRENTTSRHNEDPLICFENPMRLLPERFLKGLKHCHLLNWEMSVMQMIQGDLCKYVDMQNSKIKRCIDSLRG